ncbi:hypothetical protein BD769DRAFT_1388909 [Suillus cothurnatus]|nr:hypothetical protein BD769DRAFT_1388909 [Suillus cothurnatus]
MAIPSVNSERANNACKRSVTRLSGHGVAHCVVKEVVDEGKACWWCNQEGWEVFMWNTAFKNTVQQGVNNIYRNGGMALTKCSFKRKCEPTTQDIHRQVRLTCQRSWGAVLPVSTSIFGLDDRLTEHPPPSPRCHGTLESQYKRAIEKKKGYKAVSQALVVVKVNQFVIKFLSNFLEVSDPVLTHTVNDREKGVLACLFGVRHSLAENAGDGDGHVLPTMRGQSLTTLTTRHKAGVMCQQLCKTHPFSAHSMDRAIVSNGTNGT